ncbi:phosphomannomutase/phosphoglucomutase [Brachybacterium sp. P6-10-X1]|uniref:phosphomannomutase/phosphoglucomutase n=1 Tax=Brachybacterium sp. P6-10-X1 TaxID=1903186 RepID=UPI000971853C|nr:phosphomannomutase/phosphoglucomutase [Brachybacterium sp. P6-10-X1]APX32443.1 phosphomannomutase/phosphoglucomutase [Brachybacterium sp. P6-10-X1]
MTEPTGPTVASRTGHADRADLSGILTAVDVRGIAGQELTVEVARAFGAAFTDHLETPALIVAHDMRLSSPELARAVIEGAVRRGAIVADAGLSATDQLYCASGLHHAAGVMVTASHNPAADNGLKLCLPEARPVSRETGLEEIRRGAEAYLDAGEIPVRGEGRTQELDTLPDYVRTLLELVAVPDRRRLRVVVDAADAMAALTAPAVLGTLDQVELIGLHLELDGTFPHHPADPLDRETLRELQETVVAEGADLGLAFDGDADRCVVLDETGTPIPPSAMTALIARREVTRARAAGQQRPAVVANLVSSRHVGEAVRDAGGEPVRAPVGHSLIKALMAEHDAVFGGEHSAHYYFRDFFYADSGMLAALHVLAALAETDAPASALFAEHDPYPSSGEINSRVRDAAAARERVRDHVARIPEVSTDDLDGLTVEHWHEEARPEDRWWFSLRSSNTEPLLRLNVEAERETTMIRIRDEILAIVQDEDLAGAEGGVAATGTSAARRGAPAAELTPAVDAGTAGGTGGAEVPGWLRSRLRCPDCGGPLASAEAALRCTQCARRHPIEGGIPVLIAGRTDPPAL